MSSSANRNLNRILLVMSLILLLSSVFALGAVNEESGVSLTYKVDSGVRRDTLNESGIALTSSTRAGTQPQVLAEQGVVQDLMQTVLPPEITDTRDLFSWKSLRTEVVWTAISLALNNSYGTIDFETTIDLSNVAVLDIDRYVNISYNYIEINGTAIPQFNESAVLTLKNLTFSNVRVLKDGSECEECTIIIYSNKDLVFNAPGFTFYQAANGSILPAIKISTRVNVTNATMNISGSTYNGSYPENVSIDIGNDGVYEWNYSGELSDEVEADNLTSALNSLLRDCTCSGCSLSNSDLTCTIDIGIDSDSQGTVILSDLNVSQAIRNATWNRGSSYTLIDLDDYFYDQNSDNLTYTARGNDSITVEITDGIVTLSAGNWHGQENVTFYANDSRNETISNNVSLTVLYASICGDGVCDGDESCSTCSADCGTCGTPDPCEGVVCDDNNPCTDDYCSEGSCYYTPNTASCDDGDGCTDNDQCSGGTCSGTPVTCETVYGTECWDGTIPECTPTCSAGSCGTCTLPSCPECIEDWSCTGWSSCSEGMQTRTCTDENSCGTTEDKPSEERECYSCTTDSDCEDGLLCTIDSCVSGVCEFTDKECADSTEYCPYTGEWISCENDCYPETGECSDCSSTLECPVDVCAGYECPDQIIDCPDGSQALCTRVCESVGGQPQCSECDADDYCVDPCEGVVCGDYCSGDWLYSSGYCEEGRCIYDSELCEFGCSDGSCEDEGLEIPLEIEDIDPDSEVNSIPCVNVTEWVSGKKLGLYKTNISGILDLPPGYEIIIDPFNLDCSGDSLDITLSIPENYIDVQAIKCSGGSCRPTEVTKVTKLVCGEEIIKEWRDETVFKPEISRISIEETNITLSKVRNVLESGNARIRFIGQAFENITAKLTVEEQPEPKNPSLRIIGTPVTLSMDKIVKSQTTITLPYVMVDSIDENSIAMYARSGEDWIKIGGKVNKERKLVIANIDDISRYSEEGKAHIALMGLVCVNCIESSLEKVYEPKAGSRDAIVLIHGLGSSPETFREIIDDVKLTEQPFQTWTFGYPYDNPTQDNADDLAETLELNSAEYDNLYIIAHSLGGIVAQKALYESFIENKEGAKYSFVDKVRKVLLIGVPNEGSPGAELYRSLFQDLVNKKGTKTLFNPNSPALDELVEGAITPRVPGVDYYVIAGTKPYEFDLVLVKVSSDELFDEGVKNDGLVSIYSAQNIGGEYIDDMCGDYWEIPVTHTELIDHPIARRLIERVITEDIIKQREGEAILGQSSYFNLAVDKCSPDDRYVIIGKRIDPAELEGICSCGNGVCGIGEDAINCPADCALFLSRERVYYFLLFLLLIPLLIILFTVAYREYRYLRLPKKARKELSEFEKQARSAERYIHDKLMGKASSAYRKVRELYVDLIGFNIEKRREKRLYRKSRELYGTIKRYEKFRERKEKALIGFDLSYIEAKGHLENKDIREVLKSYKELSRYYSDLIEIHIGLFKEIRLYRKVKEVYKEIEGLRKEYQENRLGGFERIYSEFDIAIDQKDTEKAASIYKEMRSEYKKLAYQGLGLLQGYGLYRRLRESYRSLRIIKRGDIDIENFKGSYKNTRELIGQEELEKAAQEFSGLRKIYIRLLESGKGNRYLLYFRIRRCYKLLRNLEKEERLRKFRALADRAGYLEDSNAAEMYKKVMLEYKALINSYGLNYGLYKRVREVYKGIKRKQKEALKERIREIHSGIKKIKELKDDKEYYEAARLYGKVVEKYSDLAESGYRAAVKRLYLDIRGAYRSLWNSRRSELIRESKEEFEKLYSGIKEHIDDQDREELRGSYTRMLALYHQLAELKAGFFLSISCYRGLREVYRSIHKKIEERNQGIGGFNLLDKRVRYHIEQRDIKSAENEFKSLNSCYISLVESGIKNNYGLYMKVRGCYDLIKKLEREEQTYLVKSLYSSIKLLIQEDRYQDMLREYHRLNGAYKSLDSLFVRIFAYRKAKQAYRDIKAYERKRIEQDFDDLLEHIDKCIKSSDCRAFRAYKELESAYHDIYHDISLFFRIKLWKRLKYSNKRIMKFRCGVLQKRAGRYMNNIKEHIRKGDIRSALEKYKLFEGFYLSIAKIPGLNAKQAYKDIKNINREIKRDPRFKAIKNSKIKELVDFIRKAGKAIDDDDMINAKRYYKKSWKTYIKLKNISWAKRLSAYIRISRLYKKIIKWMKKKR